MTALLDDPSVLRAPGAGGSFVQGPRSAARFGPRAGGGRAGSGRAGASALARADRCRPRRLRRERRRRRPDGAGAPAQPAARAIAALAETGQLDAVLALIGNLEIDLPAELLAPHFRPLQRRRERARGAARAPVAAGELEGAHRGGGGEGFGRRGVAMDAARAGRAHRPRGARSGDLYDRFVMPSRRAGGAHARAARSRRADAGLAAAFAAWRRTGLCSPQALAELSGLPLPRVAAFILEPQRGRLCRARPPGWLEGRRPARLSRRARRDQNSGRRGWRRPQTVRWCKRSSTNASGSTIPRSPRFGRCCGASPPKRRRRKPRRFAREAAASASGGRLPPILEFSPVNDDSGHAPKLTGPAPLNLSARLDNAA